MDNQGPDCIYLIDAQTGTKRKLTNPAANSWADFLPAFSPDGREIAFVRAVNERGITDIFVADTATGKTRQVTFDGRTVSGLAWASRKQLVFTSNRTVGQMLWTIGSDGGNPELIADAGRNVARVSASRDGGRLVMVTSFRNTNIYRADLSKRGESVVKLISSSGRNDSPKYSPDGARVVFASDRSGWYELWIANADGTHARQLTHFDGRAIGTPRWSPDGTRIVFDGAKETRSAIYIIEASGGAPRVFAEDRRSCILPSWSQDGRFIYFVIRNDSGRSLLWKKPLNGGPAVQLTHQSYGDAIEAADGTVYFSDGQNGFWSVSNDGSNEAPVPGLERFRNTRYYALGARGIYSLRNVTAPWIIDLYDFKTHRTSPVASIERGILFGMPNLSVSPDDRWLLFTQLDGSGSDIQMVESYR
jgi:Tol biopolymer transport system component